MVGYLDPSAAAVGYVGAVAVNMALGGSETNFAPAVDYFKALHKNQPIVPKPKSFTERYLAEVK
jgi:putative spermidine/putrescine transport system substrate-binding protein